MHLPVDQMSCGDIHRSRPSRHHTIRDAPMCRNGWNFWGFIILCFRMNPLIAKIRGGLHSWMLKQSKWAWSSTCHAAPHRGCDLDLQEYEVFSTLSRDGQQLMNLDCIVRGYHVYQDIREALHWETLPCRRETSHGYDPFAVGVVKNGVIRSRASKILRFSPLFLRSGSLIMCWVADSIYPVQILILIKLLTYVR